MSLTKKQIPNILTIIRIVMAFAVFGLLIGVYVIWSNYSQSYQSLQTKLLYASGAIFVCACLTDMIDGMLARKFKWSSDFGKIWDPLADKILINIVFIAFSVLQLVPWYLTAIIISRDVIVDGMKMYASSKNNVVAADIFGKLKTIFQMLGITTVFVLVCVALSCKCSFNHVEWFWLDNAYNINLRNFIHIVFNSWGYYVILNGLIFVATFFSLFSGINYIIKINKLVRKSASEH